MLAAEAKEGALKITKLTADGSDLELVGDGKVTIKEPWTDAIADLFLRFKFTDAYRGKSPLTKTLLGDPGSSLPGTIEMLVPKMKQAKRPDGFFGFHIAGPLKRLRFDPYTAEAGGAGPGRPSTLPKRPLPIGGRPEMPFGGIHRPSLVTPPATPPRAAREHEEPQEAPTATAEQAPSPPARLRPLAPQRPPIQLPPQEAPAREAPEAPPP